MLNVSDISQYFLISEEEFNSLKTLEKLSLLCPVCNTKYKRTKKKKFYFIYGFWVVFFGILCTMMGSASGVDHTFDYGMNSLELYLGKKNYFEGNVIYAEDDYKHNGDFILEYYVKNTEDIEIISKQIVEENVFIFRAYNLSDINVVWKSVDDELYVYGGDRKSVV